MYPVFDGAEARDLDGMRCTLVLTSLEASEGCPSDRFGERRVRPFCHLAVRQQTWQKTLLIISRRWFAIVGIAKRFPSLALWARRQLQTSASVEVASCGGRYASLFC